MTEASLAPIGSVRELMSSAPFDTVAMVLERRAHAHRSTAPLLLAAASWCAVIRDDIVEARRLAAQAIRSRPGCCRCGLSTADRGRPADVIGGVGAQPEPAALDRIAELFLTETGDAPGRLRSNSRGCWKCRTGSRSPIGMTTPRMLTVASPIDHARPVRAGVGLVLPRRARELPAAGGTAPGNRHWRPSAAVEMGDDAVTHAPRPGSKPGEPTASCEEHIRTAWALSLKRGDRSTQWRAVGAEAFAAASLADWTRSRVARAVIEPGDGVGACLASVRLWDGDYLESLVRLTNGKRLGAGCTSWRTNTLWFRPADLVSSAGSPRSRARPGDRSARHRLGGDLRLDRCSSRRLGPAWCSESCCARGRPTLPWSRCGLPSLTFGCWGRPPGSTGSNCRVDQRPRR
jgi:hypothetical protein